VAHRGILLPSYQADIPCGQGVSYIESRTKPRNGRAAVEKVQPNSPLMPRPPREPVMIDVEGEEK
jgi:hypothetical protein